MTHRNHLRKSVVVKASGRGPIVPVFRLPEQVGPAPDTLDGPIMQPREANHENPCTTSGYADFLSLPSAQGLSKRLELLFPKKSFSDSVLNFI
jgi:hypothetical protein